MSKVQANTGKGHFTAVPFVDGAINWNGRGRKPLSLLQKEVETGTVLTRTETGWAYVTPAEGKNDPRLVKASETLAKASNRKTKAKTASAV